MYHLNSNVGQLFELKTAVVLPGQFAGTFRRLYLYGVQPFLLILLTLVQKSVKRSCRHRSKRATIVFSTTVLQTCSRTSVLPCNHTVTEEAACFNRRRASICRSIASVAQHDNIGQPKFFFDTPRRKYRAHHPWGVTTEYPVDDAGQLYVPLEFTQIADGGANDEEIQNKTKN